MLLPILLLILAASAAAQDSSTQIKRPAITGLAHVALWVKDVAQSRVFYKDLLGLEEPYDLKNSDGSLALTFLKVNERQYLELFPEREAGSDRLHHISIETDDAEGMRRYLRSKGIAVPDRVPKGRIGNLNFTVKDADGHGVEIVQYAEGSWSQREKGKFLGPHRVSRRMLHTGIIVGSTAAALKFYRDILGFRETWRGSRNSEVLDWINLRVPEGEDYIEFMLYGDSRPAGERLGVMHHICLEVPDMAKAVAHLESRPARKGYSRTIESRVGVNRRRQANLYDPDGTRVELMELRTVDGFPAPYSTAPPPRP